ncbi:MAG: 3-phosphoshikimate 1-carboxyvinyltransferase [candidate division KSB1 bacterium]|nr:3-phosphoshikimate 1-carboxyvinyltransferase [candidate division KSB1 bacterium]
MSERRIKPVSRVDGNIRVPGDKSISHRALIFNAIAKGESRITGLLNSADVKSTENCLKQLGVSIEDHENGKKIIGRGIEGLEQPSEPLNAGNSGTTIRLLSGVLASLPFVTEITGDESLINRPMRRIIEPLEQMYATVESDNYRAPLKIRGGHLNAIDYSTRISSAQVKSCILLAGLSAKGMTQITEPYRSRDHSERMLSDMQVTIKQTQTIVAIKGPTVPVACDIDVPGDISAAAFFIAAAALLPDSELLLENVGINPARTGVLDALSAMGAQFQYKNQVEINREPRADIRVISSKLNSTHISGPMIPSIIDEIPILAVAATQAHGTTTIRDAGELRVKESDRISALVDNLKRMGADVREKKDGLVIKGPVQLKGAEIDSYKDHRIAMAFSIAGLIAKGETVIKDTDCVSVSFPDFYEKLEHLTRD